MKKNVLFLIWITYKMSYKPMLINKLLPRFFCFWGNIWLLVRKRFFMENDNNPSLFLGGRTIVGGQYGDINILNIIVTSDVSK